MNKISNLTIEQFEIELHRKRIKNMHLRVLAPDGKVRVSAPLFVSNKDIEHFVMNNRAWIKATRESILSRPNVPEPEYLPGEEHWFLGERYPIEFIPSTRRPRIEFKPEAIRFWGASNLTIQERQKLLTEGYRKKLKFMIPHLLKHWEPIVGVSSNDWTVRLMKSKWGTCNIQDKRICLNLELIKYPQVCIEYVLVHELVHLHERYHNARFYRFMDEFLPDWKEKKTLLNSFEK